MPGAARTRGQSSHILSLHDLLVKGHSQSLKYARFQQIAILHSHDDESLMWCGRGYFSLRKTFLLDLAIYGTWDNLSRFTS